MTVDLFLTLKCQDRIGTDLRYCFRKLRALITLRGLKVFKDICAYVYIIESFVLSKLQVKLEITIILFVYSHFRIPKGQ